VPGGVGLFFALPTASYCRTATMAFCAPKPAAWACCTVGIS
jgi:hypothetical protein